MLCRPEFRTSQFSLAGRPASADAVLLLVLSASILQTSWPRSLAIAAAEESRREGPVRTEVIVEGKGWNSIRVGMSREDLVRALGEPDDDSSQDCLKWENDNDIECTLHKGEKVSEIRFSVGFKGGLQNGVKLGSSANAVLDLYRVPSRTIEHDNWSQEYVYANKGISFWVYHGQIVQIAVFKPTRTEATPGEVECIEARTGTNAAETDRQVVHRMQSANNLNVLAVAMHDYLYYYHTFPPAVLYAADGKTPYSWRVALLPFLGQQDLYERYHFDEPWDSPNNRSVQEKMPAVYHCPAAPPGSTDACYFAPVGPGTLFEGDRGVDFGQIVDGVSGTILLVEAKRDIPWTKPEDIRVTPHQPLPVLGGFFDGGCNVVMAHGAMRFLPTATAEDIVRGLISRSGRENIDLERVFMAQPATKSRQGAAED